ncbi:MAG: L-serine ammonia-lyase, iron-sulfur-dependent, subunit alpha [Oscillospiraceae bacterium]|nr:L-serine ammonia-lyase, iron-sulfur-dependent, subunit alpha [Oscillospiraceae bacterium]
MDRDSQIYRTYLQILDRELIPAMGCTEPIAVAYCAAIARRTLGSMPERVEIEASGNIIKNVKSVVVPNTGGLRGVEAAAAIGIVAGDDSLGLEVVSRVSEEDKSRLKAFMAETPISVRPARSNLVLDVSVKVCAGEESARARIINHHTGLALIEKNGSILFEDEPTNPAAEDELDYSLLTVAGIYDFAVSLEIDDVRELFEKQIKYNCAIAQEGLENDYGANIGKVLITQGDDVHTMARAKAAAASDARMSGCELPVVINSGSGNQGITVSVPVVEYSLELGSGENMLYRALAISNLTAIHLKEGIGRLSAYCGAVSAGASAGAAISFLCGGDLDSISHTIVNALAISSGMVCDGAKPSCAAKIAVAVDCGLLAMEMYDAGQQFYGGDGIVRKGVENTISNISVLGRDGMRETDRTIIELMTQ